MNEHTNGHSKDVEEEVRFQEALSSGELERLLAKAMRKTAAGEQERPLVKLSIRKFGVAAELANNHVCGTGERGAFYTEVTLSARKLDENGFVVDNSALIAAVRESFRTTMFVASCEQLAEAVVNVAHKLMGGRLVSAKATVFNETGSVEIEWEDGQVVPSFPRAATKDEVKRTRESNSIKSC